MKSYIIIGLGRFGQTLARQLCALGAEVLALDKRSDLVQQVAEDVTHAVVGDGQDKEVLTICSFRSKDETRIGRDSLVDQTADRLRIGLRL